MVQTECHVRGLQKTVQQGGHKGFTLIEILVTVGIIITLSVLLVGGYQKVVTGAQAAKNLSNHRTIARGIIAYSGDFKGQLPWAVDYDPPFGNGASSYPNSYSPYPKTLCILGYISDGSVFFSPKFWRRWGNKDAALLVSRNPEKYPSAVVPWFYSNYGANRYGAMPQFTDGKTPANLLRVGGDGNLSKLMLTRDTYEESYDKAPSLFGGGVCWFSNDKTIPKEEDCYSGIVYASFADGHVDAFSREDMEKMMKAGSAAPMFNNVYTLP